MYHWMSINMIANFWQLSLSLSVKKNWPWCSECAPHVKLVPRNKQKKDSTCASSSTLHSFPERTHPQIRKQHSTTAFYSRHLCCCGALGQYGTALPVTTSGLSTFLHGRQRFQFYACAVSIQWREAFVGTNSTNNQQHAVQRHPHLV